MLPGLIKIFAVYSIGRIFKTLLKTMRMEGIANLILIATVFVCLGMVLDFLNGIDEAITNWGPIKALNRWADLVEKVPYVGLKKGGE